MTLSLVSLWLDLQGVGVNLSPLERIFIFVVERGFWERLIIFGFSCVLCSILCFVSFGAGLKNVGCFGMNFVGRK